MNRLEAAKLLGISLRTLQRRMFAGDLKYTRVGGRVEFSRADLGLEQKPEPDRRTADLGPLAVDLTGDLPKALPVAPSKVSPRLDCTLEEMDQWDIEDLQAAVLIWHRPDNPHGAITNVPAKDSSTMPNPENFQRLTHANHLLFIDEMKNRPRVISRQPYYGLRRTVTADCAAHNSRVANLGREL